MIRPARARAIAWRKLRNAARIYSTACDVADSRPSSRAEADVNQTARELRDAARSLHACWPKEAP
jgi:hypothetical protein